MIFPRSPDVPAFTNDEHYRSFLCRDFHYRCAYCHRHELSHMDIKQTQQLIEAQNATLRAKFIQVIAQAKWRLLERTDTISPSQTDHLIVIGVAFWSDPDLQALHKLSERLLDKHPAVFVFDIDLFGYSDGVKTFIPGIKMPPETPIVAEYIGGTLVQTCSGNSAFRWIVGL